MKRLDLSLADHPSDLALDEALLDDAELRRRGETLRLWQFERPVVVIGRGSKIAGEVDLGYCQANQIPVLRRCSGGAAIVAGPGCLMYSVVLSCHLRPELRRIDESHRWVMMRLMAAIVRQVPDVQWQGTCDLTLDNRKFSGNSLRVARDHILYHGTILHSADLSQIARCLTAPPRQPDYRGGRDHSDFITNLPVQPQQLADDIAAAFEAVSPEDPTAEPDWPRQTTHSLMVARYSDPAWHHRH
jgi:lipoate-protein ligase A